MKRVFFGLLMLLSVCAQAQIKAGNDEIYLFSYFKNNGQDGLHLAYSIDGLKWEALRNDSSFLRPMVSKDKLMRDPCIIRGADGLFHMVWTDSWTDKGIGYASSKDLLTWSEQRQLPVMEHEEGARNCWAPEITYDKGSKTYMIYWSTTIKGRFPNPDTTAEAGYNHRVYYITTKDFKTFTPTKLLFDPGFNVIDATIIPDGKRFVMFFKDERLRPLKKNLRVAYSKKIAGPYNDIDEAPITGKYWAEGPTTLRMDNKWIVFFDKYREHKYGAVTSDNLKTWMDISDQISMPKGLRHGTILKITKAELEKLK